MSLYIISPYVNPSWIRFTWEIRTLPGGYFARPGPYWALKSTLWAPSSFKIIGKTYYSSNIAANKLVLCAQMPCITISLHTWCSNHGIITFPIAKLTIPGGHESLLAPKTEVRSRSRCTAGTFLSSQIASVGSPGVHQIVVGNTISGI